MNTQNNTPASRNEEAVALQGLHGFLLSCAAKADSSHDAEVIRDWARGVSVLAAPGAAIDAGGQENPALSKLITWAVEAGKRLNSEDHEVRDRLREAVAEARYALASRPEAPPASASPATGAQPVAKYADSTSILHVGDSAFEDWYQNYLPNSVGHKQIARDAYAAGMGDPLVIARDAAQPCASQGCGGAVVQPVGSVVDHYDALLTQIGDFAHDHSTGPAVSDDLWEIRRMAYEGIGSAPTTSPRAPQWPGNEAVYALKWCAAALQALVESRGETGSINMIVSGEKKSLEDVLDLANAALSTAKSVEHGATDGGTGRG